MVNDLDGERFDAMWGQIFVRVGRISPDEPWVHKSSRREARVGSTHVSEPLHNGEDFVTYTWSPDWLTTAAGGAGSDAVMRTWR